MPPARLPRDNLMVWHDDANAVRPVRTPADWQKRRDEIVRGMLAVMGPLPGPDKRCPVDVKVDDEADCGSYVRRSITYQAEPGGRVPAYLCIPKTALAGKAICPAVLCLHPTDDRIGCGVVVGLGGAPGRQYAGELADRGYVTLAPGYPLLAGYRPDLKQLGYVSGTMKAIWDNMRALDVLESLPFVKCGGFGVIGHSLGGHNAVYTAVLDERIAAIVSSCGLDSYLDYMDGSPAAWAVEKGWCQLRYMPRLLDYAGRLEDIPFDFHELIGALAPRHVFLSAPRKDDNFKWQSVDRIAAAASQVYRLYGTLGRLRVEHPDGPHEFSGEMRSVAYRFLDAVLMQPVRANEGTRI
ncbi:MAG: alpha/beta hydrolase [Verrucomicrobia bacterium]|nr:alpha/beta hydrolase [Verrucomicrobiota bacterium]